MPGPVFFRRKIWDSITVIEMAAVLAIRHRRYVVGLPVPRQFALEGLLVAGSPARLPEHALVLDAPEWEELVAL